MIFFPPVIVKYMEKHLNISKPCYSEQILPVYSTSLYRGSTIFRPTHNRTSSCKFLEKTHCSVVHFKNKQKKKNSFKGFMAYPLSQEFLCSPAKKKKEKKIHVVIVCSKFK